MSFMRLIVIFLAIGLLAWFGLQLADQESAPVSTITPTGTALQEEIPTKRPTFTPANFSPVGESPQMSEIVAELGEYVNLRFSPTDKEDNIIMVLTTGTIVQYIRCEKWVPVVYNEIVNGFLYHVHIDACK